MTNGFNGKEGKVLSIGSQRPHLGMGKIYLQVAAGVRAAGKRLTPASIAPWGQQEACLPGVSQCGTGMEGDRQRHLGEEEGWEWKAHLALKVF